MENTINKRIVEIIKYLDISGNEFAKRIGIPQTTFSNIINRDSDIKSSTLQAIINQFGFISLMWLLTGEGEMLKSEDLPNPTSDQAISYRLVPLLNLDAVGGMHKANLIAENPEYIEKLIPFTDAQDGDVALTISGDSMSPTCPAGSKVLIREVSNWKEYFGFGNIFVILLTDGRRILKEVQKFQEDSKNYILCRSHNDKYPEEELPKSMIQCVWKVVKILNERGW